jgi:hypothetical protein
MRHQTQDQPQVSPAFIGMELSVLQTLILMQTTLLVSMTTSVMVLVLVVGVLNMTQVALS